MPSPSIPLRVDRLESWNDLQVRLGWAYSGATAYPHWITQPTMLSAWLIRRGHVDLTFDGEKRRYGTGQWIFLRAAQGWQDFSEDARLLSVRFEARWASGEPLFDRSATVSFPAARAPRLAPAGDRLARFVARSFPGTTVDLGLAGAPDPGKYFELQRLLYGWVAEYTAAMRRQGLRPNAVGRLDERVRLAVGILDRLPLNRPIREPDLAREIGVSVTQLNRLFVQNLGRTPAEHWERRRIDAARTAIVETTRTMKSIAYDTGFGSLPHFSTWVRKKLGSSPRALRRQLNPSGTG